MAPRKTAEEKAEAKKIRAEQEQLLTNTYADTAAVKNILRDIGPAVQATEARFTQKFDVLSLTPAQKTAAKAISVPYQSIRELRANINALQLMVDEFEEGLTTEWKSEQKKSLEKRDVYLKKKVVEMNELSKRFRADVKRNVKGAGIRIPGWEDDEENGEGAKAGGEEGQAEEDTKEKGWVEKNPAADIGKETEVGESTRGTGSTQHCDHGRRPIHHVSAELFLLA
ncbi:hypothetical protein DE146DRAFT_637451 [Phaeosphaeria sp. MPI-PUGE-AT-0046c]|nr:hypothetical protein DE146DRAFT_637451 [Phaeosphaeria sp. MPI-PUGE-AT-0046c]